MIKSKETEKWIVPSLIFLAVAALTRAPLFGNPVIHIDEQFYLFVGDQILHGALPYTDIWDRKPLGLFLLYAAIRALGGDGIYQYQVIAMLSAAATAFVVFRIARTVARPVGATIAGIAYLLYILTFNGAGGQSSVFYNFLVACAALLTIHAINNRDQRHLFRDGAIIMLLLGLAIQIKYTVIFEGILMGLALLWGQWRNRPNVVALIATALVWIACALVPTIAALGFYAAHGQTEAFIQANFLSIFGRQEPIQPALKRLATTVAFLIPFWLAILKGWKIPSSGTDKSGTALVFLRVWAAVAVGGYLLFGSYYDHYAIPLLMPLAVISAPVFSLPGPNGVFYSALAILTGLVSGAIITIDNIKDEGSVEQFNQIARVTARNLAGGCLHIYEGPPMLYKATGACLVTRYAFPSHFNNLKERVALGVNTNQAIEAMLANRPAVIILSDKPRPKISNLETRALLTGKLKSQYDMVARMPLGKRNLLIYRIRNSEAE